MVLFQSVIILLYTVPVFHLQLCLDPLNIVHVGLFILIPTEITFKPDSLDL
jgi:hypothetical protein